MIYLTRCCILLTIGVLFFCAEAISQEFEMENGRINTCSGTFYDSGGPGALITGRYGNNENLTYTICPDDPGKRIRLTFTQFRVVDEDVICFYDGQSTTDPLLSCWDDKVSQGGLDGLFGGDFEKTVQATLENNSGCLTVKFESTRNGRALGWTADISCEFKCQQIVAGIESSMPEIVPADTGWIDICLGETISLTGFGEFPESGNPNTYLQSEANSTFTWNFGDGSSATGKSVQHTYQNSGGYLIQLTLTDQLGCKNSNAVVQRVRVAPEPAIIIGDVPSDLCIGDSISLTSAVNSEAVAGKTISITPNSGGFQAENIRADSIPLPDGEGVFYEAGIQFNTFSPSQVITDPSQIKRICVNIEHTWARDMEIELECPDGTKIVLHDFQGQEGNEIYLGMPIDGDNAVITPGAGSTYCWTNDGTQTWLEFANTNFGPNSTRNVLPPGDYAPVDPFSNLVGCPINGDWTIIVKDLWLFDNGFVFWWSIEFDETVQPVENEDFVPNITSFEWSGPDIVLTDADSIVAVMQNEGDQIYQFAFTDEYGCSYDTTLNVTVRPANDPECNKCERLFVDLGAGQDVCGPGETIPLEVRQNPNNPDQYQQYSYEWSPVAGLSCTDCPNPVVTASSTTTYTVRITDGILCDITDEVTIGVSELTDLQIDSLTIEPPGCAMQDLGAASVFVSGGTGNYTYQWTDPSNQTTFHANDLPEGTYTVFISDDSDCTEDISTEVTIQATSPMEIGLAVTNIECFGANDGAIDATVSGGTPPYSFQWSNGAMTEDLQDLPAQTFELVVTDGSGCEERATTEIVEPGLIETVLTITPPSCFGFGDGMINVAASGGTPPLSFQINNGTPSSNNNILGLDAGDYFLRIEDGNGCFTEENVQVQEPAEFSIDAGPALQEINLGDQLELNVEAINAAGAVTYSWSGNSTDTISCSNCQNNVVGPMRSTTYRVTGQDENGCEASDEVRVTVKVERVIEVPTGFSPNEDSANDRLLVHGTSGTKVITFRVFNRWGELVYETGDFEVNNKTMGWDGRFRGQMAPAGSYIWHLRVEFVDGFEKNYKGQTNLIR